MEIEKKRKIELQIINNFILKEKRARFKEIVTNRKIGDGLGELAHVLRYLDLRFFIKVPSMDSIKEIKFVMDQVKNITDLNKCYVLSENKDLDGCEIPIEKALQQVIGSCEGTFLVMDDGYVVFHESESKGERYLGWRSR